MRASRGLKWENKMYKLKRSIVKTRLWFDDIRLNQLASMRFPIDKRVPRPGKIHYSFRVFGVEPGTFRSSV